MRRAIIHIMIIAILAVLVWGYVGEVFDQWDQTIQTGNDLEFSLVLVALSLGAVLVTFKLLAIRFFVVFATGQASRPACRSVFIAPASFASVLINTVPLRI